MNDPNIPVRVAMTSEVYFPNLPGGLLRFFRYGPGMKARGVQFHMHTKRDTGQDETELETNGILISRHDLPGGISHHSERQILVERACKDLDGRRAAEAVCVQPNGVTWSSARTMKRLRRRGFPFVMSFSMFPEEAPDGILRRLRRQLGLRMLASPFDRFITCSKRMKAAYEQRLGVPSEKIEVLRNGVDLARFSTPGAEEKRAIRDRLELAQDCPIVLFSGSITRRKGVDLLLKAWPEVLARHPGAKLLLAGSLGRRKSFRDPEMRADLDAFTDEFNRMLAELSYRDSVVPFGELDSVNDYYRAADVFVFPSRLEGLPNSVLEAMASGLACVVSPFKGIPDDGEEFGFHGREFVRSTHQPTRIAADLIELLADEGRRREMGGRARQWMVENQSLDATLDQLATIYRDVAVPPRS